MRMYWSERRKNFLSLVRDFLERSLLRRGIWRAVGSSDLSLVLFVARFADFLKFDSFYYFVSMPEYYEITSWVKRPFISQLRLLVCCYCVGLLILNFKLSISDFF